MKPPVLLYHKIDLPTPDIKVRGAFTAPRIFEKQVAYLVKKQIKVVTVGELVEHYNSFGEFPARTLAISFDDGWKDNFTHAFPILKKYGLRATIYLVADCLGRTTDQVVPTGEEPREHISADDVREMAGYGVEFGSHTLSHRWLNEISPDEVDREMIESRSFVENLTQTDCKTIAYPAGFFNDHAKSSAKAAGYLAAFSTIYGDDSASDLFELNRTEILRRDKFMFRYSRKISLIDAV
ncbi:MAG TPA: polysaccharide deacetylase family protein [Pyrinomonadaceae bacterium]|nr:polysaccharide deacetylase family protein [Pyrinomonadaceae bacterium]